MDLFNSLYLKKSSEVKGLDITTNHRYKKKQKCFYCFKYNKQLVRYFKIIFLLWYIRPRICPVMGFPCGSAGKESSCNAEDLALIPELGRSPGEGKGYPLQYSGLENSGDCIIHRVAKSRTRLSKFHSDILINSYIRSFYPKPQIFP